MSAFRRIILLAALFLSLTAVAFLIALNLESPVVGPNLNAGLVAEPALELALDGDILRRAFQEIVEPNGLSFVFGESAWWNPFQGEATITKLLDFELTEDSTIRLAVQGDAALSAWLPLSIVIRRIEGEYVPGIVTQVGKKFINLRLVITDVTLDSLEGFPFLERAVSRVLVFALSFSSESSRGKDRPLPLLVEIEVAPPKGKKNFTFSEAKITTRDHALVATAGPVVLDVAPAKKRGSTKESAPQ